MSHGDPVQEAPQASEDSAIATVAIRLPPYWDRNPAVWFLQAESQFHLAGITSQQRKYHYIVSALSPSAAEEVYDVLANPSATAPFEQLKSALLQRTAASERTRLKQLLSSEELGDRRPSQLLRKMTQLLGGRATTVDDALLRELFLQRLPANVQLVLATATTMSLAELAALADVVMEVAVPSVSTVAISPLTPTALAPNLPNLSLTETASFSENIDRLCRRLENLEVQVNAVTQSRAQSPLRRRSTRRRSTSRRSDNQTRSPSPASELCHYHRRFGADARHCLLPCSWQGNRLADH